ncbi:hypothetical protein [Arundinibacter roseus]|uniref:Uncharacterized protein n=1 Tax=Arundinibacter roseus TaxID=2070510 RepID=A0A4R4JZM4_9BACT|nr:hypothetical protein [Arundinibacter roseus]TDB60410.1 hypothetical protein EZE20_20985 [Arundinibacter roseus]
MIAYKEKYDFTFAYLHFPYSPFDLAVFEDKNQIVARPIIDVDQPPHSPFFTYEGKVYKTDQFEARDDSVLPESLSDWLNDRVCEKPFAIDLKMSESEKGVFNIMLERKKIRMEIQIEEINEWLSKK